MISKAKIENGILNLLNTHENCSLNYILYDVTSSSSQKKACKKQLDELMKRGLVIRQGVSRDEQGNASILYYVYNLSDKGKEHVNKK